MGSEAEIQSPLAAISLNSEMAPDMVEWHYSIKMLKIQYTRLVMYWWIQLLYRHPEDVVQTNRLDRIIKTFIWNGKQPQTYISKLQGPANKGGLGLPKLLGSV